MTELVTGILGKTFLCSVGYILVKLCSLRDEVQDVSPEYLLITKEHYEIMKNNPNVKKIVFEQPQFCNPLLPEQPQLPSYSERAPPLIKL